MIKLNLKAEPYWIDLLPGVRVEVLPARTSLMLAARDDLPQAAQDEDGEDAAFDQLAYGVAVARRAIQGWEGIGDADGTPLPVTPDSIAAAMDDYPFFLAFQRHYLSAAYKLVEEGND